MNEELKRKQAKRIERKKKKIVAFLEVAQLNEDDRKAKRSKTKGSKTEIISLNTEEVPATKRARKEDELVINDVPNEGEEHDDSHDLGSSNPGLTNCEISELKKMLWEKKSKLLNGTSNLNDPSTSYINKDISELTKILREKRKKYSQIPKFSLKESGTLASFCMREEHRIPLFMVDIQHLIMWSLLGHHSPFDPSRWYTLQKFNRLSHTVVLAVDGISVNDLRSASGFLNLPSPGPDDEPDTKEPISDKLFPWKIEFIAPLSYGNTLVKEIATVPLSNSQYEKVIKTYGSLEKALKGKAVYKVFRTMFPVQTGSKSDNTDEIKQDASAAEEKTEINTKDKFPRTHLLLSPDQMVEIGYPMPLVKTTLNGAKQPLMVPNEMNEAEAMIAGSVGALIKSSAFKEHAHDSLPEGRNGDANGKLSNGVDQDKIETEEEEEEADEELYIYTKSSYKEVGPSSPMFAVDCEMCITADRRSELTRISIVNENLEVVYNTLVKPHRKITNYLTRFSGITEKMLKGVKTRLKDVQQDVANLLPPDAILVGQSLNFDLHAMKMMHPYVIDTSVVFNLSGIRSRRTKLATLSRLFLSENIQCGGSEGHDSVEDAQAAMKLVLLKLSNSIHFGDAVLSDQLAKDVSKKSKKNCRNFEMSFRQMKMIEDLQIGKAGEKAYATSIFNHINRGKRAAAVIGVNEAVSQYETFVVKENSNGDCKDLNQSDVKPPKILGFEHSSEVITHACEVMLEYHLCVVHISKDSVGEKLRTLKKWCKRIVKHSAPNSLCIVVIGGTEHSNGACFVNLKGPSEEVT